MRNISSSVYSMHWLRENRWRSIKAGHVWSGFLVLVMRRAAAFCTLWILVRRWSNMPYIKQYILINTRRDLGMHHHLCGFMIWKISNSSNNVFMEIYLHRYPLNSATYGRYCLPIRWEYFTLDRGRHSDPTFNNKQLVHIGTTMSRFVCVVLKNISAEETISYFNVNRFRHLCQPSQNKPVLPYLRTYIARVAYI